MFDQQAFRDALGCFLSGVTIVTAGTTPDDFTGLTANAFTAVSLDPPMVLVCVDNGSRSLPLLRAAGKFAVHIATRDQKDAALTFASKSGDKAAGFTPTVTENGIAVLPDALARFECELVHDYAGGDHRILVGRVLAFEANADRDGPLTYYCGQLGVFDDVFLKKQEAA